MTEFVMIDRELLMRLKDYMSTEGTSNGERLYADLLVAMNEAPVVSQTKTAVFVSVESMVDRFLSWKLPDDFYPDCYITFDRDKAASFPNGNGWPIGTNLFTAEQVRKMLEHVIGFNAPAQQAAEPVGHAFTLLRGREDSKGGAYFSTEDYIAMSKMPHGTKLYAGLTRPAAPGGE